MLVRTALPSLGFPTAAVQAIANAVQRNQLGHLLRHLPLRPLPAVSPSLAVPIGAVAGQLCQIVPLIIWLVVWRLLCTVPSTPLEHYALLLGTSQRLRRPVAPGLLVEVQTQLVLGLRTARPFAPLPTLIYG